MPFAYPDPEGLKHRLVAQLRAGAWAAEVCGREGMPSWTCFRVWARGDAEFAAALEGARAAGAKARRGWFYRRRAEALLAQLARGVSLRTLLARPGMPSQAEYARWRGERRFWRGPVDRLAAAQAAGRWARRRAGRRRGGYRPFDAAVGERLYVRLWMGGATLREILRSDPAFPSQMVLARWRREQPEFDAMLTSVMGAWRRKRGVRGGYSPELAEAVVDGIIEGGSLRSLGQDPDLPCQRTLYNWVRTRPDFAAAVAQ